ncbi:anion permease [Chloroflexota bacterium]
MLDEFLLVVIFAVAIGFGFSNGINDAANAVAASIGCRALSPRIAIAIAALFNLIGPFVGAWFGAKVAMTIGKGILATDVFLETNAVTNEVASTDVGYAIVIGAVGAAIIWTVVATRLGLPISVSHSLISGLVGAGIATSSEIGLEKFFKTLSAVVCAPLLGFVGAFLLLLAIFWLFHRVAPGKVRELFKRLQWLTTAFLAYAHGNNDGQMPIALMMMGLMLYTGNADHMENTPHWATIATAAIAISLGTAIGGWRVIKTVGLKVTKLEPASGFAATFSAAGVIEVASHLGIPVSTTHCGVSSVMGAGATQRLSAVRWGVTGNIVTAWIMTFPVCIGLGWLLTIILNPFI